MPISWEEDIWHEFGDRIRHNGIKHFVIHWGMLGYAIFTVISYKLYYPRFYDASFHSNIMVECGNIVVLYFYKFLFIYCCSVTCWMFFSLILNVYCTDSSHFVYYFFIIVDGIYGVFSVLLGAVCLFIDINDLKCNEDRPAFFNFILVNIVFGLGCLMRSCLVIILFLVVMIMRYIERWRDDFWWRNFSTTFKKIKFCQMNDPDFTLCSICCEEYNGDDMVYISDC